jgi:predicted DNA binding CopG/RHH family protein
MIIDPVLIKTLKQMQSPYKITVDLVDKDTYIGLRIYENEVMALSDERQLTVIEYLHKMREIIKSFGYKCFFEGEKGDPPRR